MGNDLAARLRALRDRLGTTVTEISDRTGIPKRTLKKYMLREGANLPGLEALVSLSQGLDVSLDWLVFGEEGKSNIVPMLVERSAYCVAVSVFESILSTATISSENLVSGERFINLVPEAWANLVASLAVGHAKELFAKGVTADEMMV